MFFKIFIGSWVILNGYDLWVQVVCHSCCVDFFGGTFVCYGQMEKSTDQEVKIFKTESETFFVCKIFSRLFLRLFATKYFQDRLQYHQKRGKS